jgi:arylsulfatase A-like enzyme
LNKNIILIFTDQQRADTIEALGNSIIKTPALNRLVERGVSFTRAYSPCPVCVPARFAMKSGLMPHQSGCFNNGPMPEQHYESFMEILAESGYRTHAVGKLHYTFKNKNNLEYGWGFQSRDTSEEGGSNDDFRKHLDNAGFEYVCDPHGVRSEMYYIPQPSQLPARLHESSWAADRSINFLKDRDKTKPFFLMTSFIKPHPPFENPTPWNKLYRCPEMPEPRMMRGATELMTFWNRLQNRYKYRDQGIDRNLIRTIIAAYYGAISFVDWNLSRLFQYMDEEKLFDNTMVIFTADHGEFLGDYNCFGKRAFLDSAARIPMLVCEPGARTGAKFCAEPVSLIDIMPTILGFAEIALPAGRSGANLLDVSANTCSRKMIFGEFSSGEYGQYMVCDGRYKYIYSAPDQKEWLFDRDTDPLETENHADNPLYERKTQGMKEEIISYFKKCGYSEPVEKDSWKIFPKPDLFHGDPDEYLLFQDPEKSIPAIRDYARDTSAVIRRGSSMPVPL